MMCAFPKLSWNHIRTSVSDSRRRLSIVVQNMLRLTSNSPSLETNLKVYIYIYLNPALGKYKLITLKLIMSMYINTMALGLY